MEPYVNLSPERTALAGTPGCPQEMAKAGKSTTLQDVFLAQKRKISKDESGSMQCKLVSGYQFHIFKFAPAIGDLLAICKLKHKSTCKTNPSNLAFH